MSNIFFLQNANVVYLYVSQGQATDIQIQAEEIIKLKRQINGLYVKHTGLPFEKIGKKGTIVCHYL